MKFCGMLVKAIALILFGFMCCGCPGRLVPKKAMVCTNASCSTVKKVTFRVNSQDRIKDIWVDGRWKRAVVVDLDKNAVAFEIMANKFYQRVRDGLSVAWATKFTFHNMVKPGTYRYRMFLDCQPHILGQCKVHTDIIITVKPEAKTTIL